MTPACAQDTSGTPCAVTVPCSSVPIPAPGPASTPWSPPSAAGNGHVQRAPIRTGPERSAALSVRASAHAAPPTARRHQEQSDVPRPHPTRTPVRNTTTGTEPTHGYSAGPARPALMRTCPNPQTALCVTTSDPTTLSSRLSPMSRRL